MIVATVCFILRPFDFIVQMNLLDRVNATNAGKVSQRRHGIVNATISSDFELLAWAGVMVERWKSHLQRLALLRFGPE